MAPSNGTTSTAPCNGTLVPASNPPKWFVALPPIGSKNPYSYRYLGKNAQIDTDIIPNMYKVFFDIPGGRLGFLKHQQ